MTEIPLFPLSSVLLPHGRMPLQIFEQRYLDLIRNCMRDGTGFGQVMIMEGGEVVTPGENSLTLGSRGCYAQIVDFDQLPNGLLGVTIAGAQRFTLHDSRRGDNDLVMGNVTLDQPLPAAAVDPEYASLPDVLRSLEAHPHVQRLQLAVDYGDAWQVGYHLAQLLPLEETLKFQLLNAPDADELLSMVAAVLSELSEGGAA